MKAWRVHGVGEPEDTFRLEDVDEPTRRCWRGRGWTAAVGNRCNRGANRSVTG